MTTQRKKDLIRSVVFFVLGSVYGELRIIEHFSVYQYIAAWFK